MAGRPSTTQTGVPDVTSTRLPRRRRVSRKLECTEPLPLVGEEEEEGEVVLALARNSDLPLPKPKLKFVISMRDL